MFPNDILLTYLAAVLVVVASPGPDNILAISRALSQGRLAAALSSFGAGLGIMAHTVAAVLGLARRPKVVARANVGAGLIFIAAGLSILALERRR